MGFFKSLIRQLLDEGHVVDIATNEMNGECPVPDCYREWGCRVYPITCTRSPFNSGNIRAIGEIKRIVKENKFDIVHCHTPIAAACTRMACRSQRKKGLRVIYTAHGFHFYAGAPLKNWLIYYPVEWLCSWHTDTLITINTEDYERAKKQFHANETVYVPGVGIDAKKFGDQSNGKRIRKEFNINNFMLLSVGELNANKNHEAVIRAVAGLGLTYVIVGEGELKEHLKQIADKWGAKVLLTGFRNDVVDFYAAADAYILPSIREGLNVSLMEAMASGLPCAVSNIRGNADLIDSAGGALFNPTSVNEVIQALETLISGDRTSMGLHNKIKINSYDITSINETMNEVYGEHG